MKTTKRRPINALIVLGITLLLGNFSFATSSVVSVQQAADKAFFSASDYGIYQYGLEQGANGLVLSIQVWRYSENCLKHILYLSKTDSPQLFERLWSELHQLDAQMFVSRMAAGGESQSRMRYKLLTLTYDSVTGNITKYDVITRFHFYDP